MVRARGWSADEDDGTPAAPDNKPPPFGNASEADELCLLPGALDGRRAGAAGDSDAPAALWGSARYW
jgi:hypothetical protein